MSKGPLIVSLLILLALQPAGILMAKEGNPPLEVGTATVLDAACERMSGTECNEASQCRVSGHVGCDLNPIQPVSDVTQTPKDELDYRLGYNASKLPLNETFPPLRPPRRS